jgi:hypothetical protein
VGSRRGAMGICVLDTSYLCLAKMKEKGGEEPRIGTLALLADIKTTPRRCGADRY